MHGIVLQRLRRAAALAENLLRARRYGSIKKMALMRRDGPTDHFMDEMSETLNKPDTDLTQHGRFAEGGSFPYLLGRMQVPLLIFLFFVSVILDVLVLVLIVVLHMCVLQNAYKMRSVARGRAKKPPAEYISLSLSLILF